MAGRSCYWPRAVIYLAPPAGTAAGLPLLAALARIGAEVEPAAAGLYADVTHSQEHHGSPEHIARRLQQRLGRGHAAWALGVGAGPVAARGAARAGGDIGIILPWETRERLRDVPVAQVWDLDADIARFLAVARARTCGEVAALPGALLARRFGARGRRLWLACRGRDPAEVDDGEAWRVRERKVLPPRTRGQRALRMYLRAACERVALRLRRRGCEAAELRISWRGAQCPGGHYAARLEQRRPDGGRFYRLLEAAWLRGWDGAAVSHIEVVAGGLRTAAGQLDLFPAPNLPAPPGPVRRGQRQAPSPRPLFPDASRDLEVAMR